MSAALVRKALAVVECDSYRGRSYKRKSKNTTLPIPDRFSDIKKQSKKGRKAKCDQFLTRQGKPNIIQLRQNLKSKEDRLKENLKKLQIIKEHSAVKLDKLVARQLIERAVTKRPVNIQQRGKKKQKKTVFTEEDFKKFEEEYIDE